MARRFGRNLENPEGNIENEGNFVEEKIEDSMDNPYDDDFDKRLDGIEKTEQKFSSNRAKFMQSIKVELPKTYNPLAQAYQELDRARQSGVKEEIIGAEDRILDLEREEEEKGYASRIAELKQMQRGVGERNDTEGLKRFSQIRKNFITEMKYDELNYKIKKLQNSQRLAPSREKLQQIMELKRELETLEMDSISK